MQIYKINEAKQQFFCSGLIHIEKLIRTKFSFYFFSMIKTFQMVHEMMLNGHRFKIVLHHNFNCVFKYFTNKLKLN